MRNLVLTITIVVAGCSKASLGGECDESTDCERGLFCARVGEYKGKCTTSCLPFSAALDTHYMHEEARASTAGGSVDPPRIIDSCVLEFGPAAGCHVEGYCYTSPKREPCDGRCPPSTTKCENGICVKK
jgi:hypothetical protein